MTSLGKRVFVLMLNLALGSEPKMVFEWLVAKKVLIWSNSDKRTVQQIIHPWKISGGEIFQNYSKSSSETNPLTCDQNSQHTSSIHEGKKLLGNKEKTVFRCAVCSKQFDRKEKCVGTFTEQGRAKDCQEFYTA